MRTKSSQTQKQAAASENPIHAVGDSKWVFVRDGKRCEMKFLDADIRKPLVLATSTVDRGQHVNARQRITTDVTRSEKKKKTKTTSPVCAKRCLTTVREEFVNNVRPKMKTRVMGVEDAQHEESDQARLRQQEEEFGALSVNELC